MKSGYRDLATLVFASERAHRPVRSFAAFQLTKIKI
jgi:hypothetical protein